VTTVERFATPGIDLKSDVIANFSPFCLLMVLKGLKILRNLIALRKLISAAPAPAEIIDKKELKTIEKSSMFQPSLR
jgi:hypothetical protein